MVRFYYIFILLTLMTKCYASWVPFIKSFVKNEGKPTFLILNSLCWDKNVEVNLAKVISQIGGRVSWSIENDSKYYSHDLLFLVDLDCPQADDNIDLALSRNILGPPYRWLFLTNQSDHTNSTLWNAPILADSDVVLAIKTESIIKFFELYKPSINSSMITKLRGSFNGSFSDMRPHRELFRRRRDIMGSTIVMSHVIQESNSTTLEMLKEPRMNPQYDSTTKICWMNAQLAFEMLNATPAHQFSYRWGYKVDGKWSGMINDLIEGRADLGSNVMLNPDRLSVAAFTDRVAPLQVRFIFRQPPLPFVTNIYSLPFHTNVWLAMSVCTVLATLCLYLAAKYEAGEGPSQLKNICDAILLSFSAVGQQGCVKEPQRVSGRVVVFVLFTVLMALYAAYSANIVVLLQAPSDSIRSLPQLASAKITLGAYDVDYSRFILKQFKDPVRMIIQKRIQPDKGKAHYYNFTDGVEKIRQGLFAFHCNAEPVYRRIEQTFLEHEKCDLVEIDYMNTFDCFIPFRKDLPYIELLRVVFKQIHESGTQAAITRWMQVPKPRCTNKLSSFSSVGLMEMRPVIILMLYGVALSVAILGAEVIVFRWKNRRLSLATSTNSPEDKIDLTGLK